MNKNQIKNQIIEYSHKVIAQANERFSIDLPVPYIHFNIKGKNAGHFRCKRDLTETELGFNLDLAYVNPETFYNTIVHEIAHYFSRTLYPFASAHGNHWKGIMTTLGVPASTRHSYDYSREMKVRNPYHYNCGCNGKTHYVSKRQHNKIGSWGCKTCKQPLVFAEYVPIPEADLEPIAFITPGLTPFYIEVPETIVPEVSGPTFSAVELAIELGLAPSKVRAKLRKLKDLLPETIGTGWVFAMNDKSEVIKHF